MKYPGYSYYLVVQSSSHFSHNLYKRGCVISPLYSYWMNGLNARIYALHVVKWDHLSSWSTTSICITNLEDVPKGRLQVGHGAVAQGVDGRRGRGQEGRRPGKGRDGDLLFRRFSKVNSRIFVVEIRRKVDHSFNSIIIHSQKIKFKHIAKM